MNKSEFNNCNNRNYALQTSDAVFCAEDIKKNSLFFHSIENIINLKKRQIKDIIVIDAGSGLGQLGAFALALGARHCYFLEHNPQTLKFCKEFLYSLGFNNRSSFKCCDAKNIQLQDQYDILISETITSGFVNEDFPFIINNLLKYKNSKAVILPKKILFTLNELNENDIVLSSHSYSFLSLEGFKQTEIKIQNPQCTKIQWLSKVVLDDTVNFESGDTMSCMNIRIHDVKSYKHPLFTFVTHK